VFDRSTALAQKWIIMNNKHSGIGVYILDEQGKAMPETAQTRSHRTCPMPVNAVNPHEDAVVLVDRMRPELQKIINQRFRGEALICAMTTSFTELLRERGGSGEPLTRAMAAFTELPAVARGQVPACHTQIKAVIAAVKQEGFSLDAILWSMLGAITNIYQGLRFPKHQIDAARDDMIMRINEARRLSINSDGS
jgi:hypothetical protein